MKRVVAERAVLAAASPKRSTTTVTNESIGAPASNLQSILATAVVAIGKNIYVLLKKKIFRILNAEKIHDCKSMTKYFILK